MKYYADNEALREKILAGVNKLADNVASTMGPRGRTVILQQAGRSPIITKDGVSVARFVELTDPIENAGAEIIKQAAEETNSAAGDGTTTATVLARAILSKAQKYLVAGASPIEIKRGIDKGVKAVVESLKKQAQPIASLDDVRHIATISANGDEVIGRLIAEAVDSIGKDGSITVKEGGSLDTTVEVVEGFRFDGGVTSSKFITDIRTNTMKYENPYFLITDNTIDRVEQIYPALELVARTGKPLIVIADEVTDEALAVMIMNAIKGTMQVAAIKAPAYGEERRQILSDLALSVGATFFEIGDDRGLKDIELKDFGTAQRVESTKLKTTIVNGDSDQEKIQERVEGIRAEISQTESIVDCEKLQARITRLVSSVAVVYVGGNTEVEMIEKKHRIEDALEAVKSAQEEGVVPGAGVALMRARAALDDIEVDSEEQRMGVRVVAEACSAPLEQILKNAGQSFDLVKLLLESEVGYNVVTEEATDPFKDGIIDPVKVARVALQNAASAAGALITTNFAVVESS